MHSLNRSPSSLTLGRMASVVVGLSALACLALACGPASLDPDPTDASVSFNDAGEPEPDDAGHEDVACLIEGAFCTPDDPEDKPCCGALACTVNDEDGSAVCGSVDCESDTDCRLSSTCVDGTCVPERETCVALGDVCEWGACCAGTFCSTELLFAYGEGTCIGPQELGAMCAIADQCASGSCVDGVCAAPEEPENCSSTADCTSGYCVDWICQETCIDQGQACQTDGCCTGMFCSVDILFSYAGGTCTVPLDDGSTCITDAHCSSGSCVDFVCTEATCADPGFACNIDFDDEDTSDGCCGGLVCLDGGYLLGVCGAPLPTGAFCWRDVECASGACSVDTMTCG